MAVELQNDTPFWNGSEVGKPVSFAETVLADVLYFPCGKVPENEQVRFVIILTARCGKVPG